MSKSKNHKNHNKNNKSVNKNILPEVDNKEKSTNDTQEEINEILSENTSEPDTGAEEKIDDIVDEKVGNSDFAPEINEEISDDESDKPDEESSDGTDKKVDKDKYKEKKEKNNEKKSNKKSQNTADKKKINKTNNKTATETKSSSKKYDSSNSNNQKTDIIEYLKEAYSNDKRPFMVIFALLAGLILLAIIIPVALHIKGRNSLSNNSASGNNVAVAVSDNGVFVVTEEPLELDVYPLVNELVQKYLTAYYSYDMATLLTIRDSIDYKEEATIQARSEYVDSFSNLTCYTKPGPFENSYIVCSVYYIKMTGYEQLSPSMMIFFVMPDENDNLFIYTDIMDQNLADYITAVLGQSDVIDLANKVAAEYNEVLDSDAEYSQFMEDANATILERAKEIAAEKKEAEEAAAGNSVSEDSVSADLADIGYDVKTTTTVNVRASDSEEADRLGQVSEGTILTCYQDKPNGWSQVIFEGEIAYIKTEFLIKLNGDNSSVGMTTGSVRALETVNIRAKDTTDGQLLGVAYMGETFPLIEHQDNGWSKIIYNNVEAYIKTEYLEDV